MNTRNLLDTMKDATSALFEGRDEDAAALLAAGVAAAGAVDVDAVAQVLEQRQAEKAAIDKFFADMPQVLVDPDMQFLADRYTAAHIANGVAVPDAIAKAGEQLREKYPDLLGQRSDAPQRANRADQEVFGEEDPSSIIAELRAARATGQSPEGATVGNQDANASAVIAEMQEMRTSRARVSS